MKTPTFAALSRFASLLGALACVTAWAADTNLPAKMPPTKPVAAAELAPIEIPKSEFQIPATASEGRDPFFPASTRMTAVTGTAKTNKTATTGVTLVLKGISGKFAIINNRTFEAGEEADVTSNGNRIHVQCLEIKEDGVLIDVGGEKRELKLRRGL